MAQRFSIDTHSICLSVFNICIFVHSRICFRSRGMFYSVVVLLHANPYRFYLAISTPLHPLILMKTL